MSKVRFPLRVLAVLVGGCGLVVLGGCPPPDSRFRGAGVREPLAFHIKDTIAAYTSMIPRARVAVQGYGVVIGLGKNGSSTIPPNIHKYLSEQLFKHGMGSWREGMGRVRPDSFLRDPDTAVVLVGGSFAPGAPPGSRFDVFVQALRGTQVRSLEGGVLMPTDMHLAVAGQGVPGGPTKMWASAAGEVFVNPFVDISKPAELAKLQEGRVIGGGTVVNMRKMYLRLHSPDRMRCTAIKDRINKQFPGLDQVGNALNASMIELTIPRRFRKDSEHFAELVMHLPVRSDAPSQELKAREIAEQMKRPTAVHHDLGLTWEGIGREVVPLVQTLYSSDDPACAFYAGRTGLRLGDEMALEVVLRVAADPNSPFRMEAIRELRRGLYSGQTEQVLRELLDDHNVMIRVAACESLLKGGYRRGITRIDVSGRLELDLVDSNKGYVLYATQVDEPRIILFGRDMKVAKPIFFSPPDNLVTVSARAADDKLMLFRKIPRSGRFSDAVYTDFHVRFLIEKLGHKPKPDGDGGFKGLGLTYGEVVKVLLQMCEHKDIPAKFVLQPLPQLRKIYQRTIIPGRPDTPVR